MMLTFLGSIGLGVFLGVRMCGVFSREMTKIEHQAEAALSDDRPLNEILDEIERLNAPERNVEIHPRWTITGPGSFTL